MNRASRHFKFAALLGLALGTALFASACEPSTPVPSPSPSVIAASPTSNFRATESSIIAHVFATMTSAAPTATRTPAGPAPTVPPTPKPTTAAKPKATTAPKAATAVPPPAAPKATVDPYLAQIPKGQGGLLITSYLGNPAGIEIGGANYPIKPNGKTLVVLTPGYYTFSVQVLAGGGSWTGYITIPMERYVNYQLPVNP